MLVSLKYLLIRIIERRFIKTIKRLEKGFWVCLVQVFIMDSLEQILNREDTKTKPSLRKRVKHFLVDVLSNTVYYSATYGLLEILGGADSDELIRTRTIGIGVGIVFGRPMGLTRDYLAEKMAVTKDSTFFDRLKVNVAAITPITAVIYGGMLIAGTAWAHYSKQTGADPNFFNSVIETLPNFPVGTWATGTAFGGVLAMGYGPFNDYVRRKFEINPAIADSK